MLGKSGERRAVLAASIIFLVSTCSHNVPQDSNTGPDGKVYVVSLSHGRVYKISRKGR